LRFDEDYSGAEFIEAANNYRGYKECDEVCKWLSDIFEQEVIIIRAEKHRVMTLNK